MNSEQFTKLLAETYRTLGALTITKGKEYAHDEDQLANFKRLAAKLDLPPQKVWFVYFTKHIDAIEHWVAHGEVLSESLPQRIDDAILYLVLLKAMFNEMPKDSD